MTEKEKIIATAYTGIMFVDGDKLGDVYDYEESKIGHGVIDIMHASKDFQQELRAAIREDFVAMLNGAYSGGARIYWKEGRMTYSMIVENIIKDRVSGERVYGAMKPNCAYSMYFVRENKIIVRPTAMDKICSKMTFAYEYILGLLNIRRK